jgi:hypothetical protein
VTAMTDRLTETYVGDGFSFDHPTVSATEVDPDARTESSVVLTDIEQPLLIAAAVEESPLDTPTLQVPGLLGELIDKYREKGGYEELLYGPLPVAGSDDAQAAEIRYGAGDPRHALLLAARIAGARIVTLQVHFPPSTADVNRPLAIAILESLRITA